MFYHDAFGLACRPRGVNHISEIAIGGLIAGFFDAATTGFVCMAKFCGKVFVDHQLRLAVRKNDGLLMLVVFGIEVDERHAGLENRNNPLNNGEAPWYMNDYPVTASDVS